MCLSTNKVHNGEGDLDEVAEPPPRTARTSRGAGVPTNKVYSGEGDLDEGAEPQTANRPPKRWCASNKVHSGEGNLDEGAEPQTAAANRPLEPKCLQTKNTVGSTKIC